jgi:hypothetical protein
VYSNDKRPVAAHVKVVVIQIIEPARFHGIRKCGSPIEIFGSTRIESRPTRNMTPLTFAMESQQEGGSMYHFCYSGFSHSRQQQKQTHTQTIETVRAQPELYTSVHY